MTEPIHIIAGRPFDYVELMGRAALALRSRRDLLRVVDGGRRMLAEKSPRPALDLKIVVGKETQCR